MAVVKDVQVPLSPSGAMRATLAVPEALDGPAPGILLIHDVFGHRPDTERHCGRFAEAGFVALAPDLYDQPGLRAGCVVKSVLSCSTGRGSAFGRLDDARAYLAERPDVDADRLAVAGFCMGGGFALLHAAQGGYAVCAPFYGPVPFRKAQLNGLCPTIAQFGAEDRVFRSHARRLATHLESLGVPHEVLIHEGAGHSFMNDHDMLTFKAGRRGPMAVRHEPEVAEQAWAAMMQFFEQHLVHSSRNESGA